MKTNSLVTSNEWLKTATQKLIVAGIDSAQLDSLILLEFCLKFSRIKILSNPNRPLSKTNLSQANKLLSKRLLNIPIAYITKQIEFYERSFFIDSRVLVPRPESESFINLLKSCNLFNLKYLTDVGCGSGILGITAKLEFPQLNIELLDKSKNAIKVTNINLDLLSIRADVEVSNLLDNSNHKSDIILANLPYIPKDMTVNKAAGFEPKMAIFASANGLYFYQQLIRQLKNEDKKPKYILIECLDNQTEEIAKLFRGISYKLIRSEGLVHQFTHHQL
ncbi:MAG TPA: HemK family protein methyltransferase [Candidatus Saccharimonadales bacterium]